MYTSELTENFGLSLRFRRERHPKVLKPVGGFPKRMMDFLILLLVAPVLLPLILGVSVIMMVFDRGPLFYGHVRVGFDGRPFRCWKFRSMATDGDVILMKYLAENPEHRETWERERKLDTDPRVTRIGAVLRKLSLDELPQVWNVLTGEMSFIGPRPVVRDELANYGASAPHYLRARPGVTGLWQVSGRSNISYRDRVRLDRYYVSQWTALTDMWILLRTIPAVLASHGAK